MLIPLTSPSIAHRPIPSLNDTRPGPRCVVCRGRIEGAAAYEGSRVFHPQCLVDRDAVKSGRQNCPEIVP